MELTSNIQRLIFKFSFVILVFSVLLWFSIFCYGLLYYLYIPAIAHVKPVHLQYDTSCLKTHLCKHPYANISLTERKHYALLTRGQVYAIELQLDMPETERNLNQGMFMIRLDMLSDEGKILQSSRRSAILRYRSPLFKVIYTLFFMPALLAGTTEEKQSLTIPLFEQYVEYEPVYYAFIEIEAKVVDIYSSTLKIHAQFTGLRYMMYYWPILSIVVGVGSNFSFLTTMIIFLYMRHVMNGSQYIDLGHLDVREQQTVEEIRRAMQARKSKPSTQLDVNEQEMEEIQRILLEEKSKSSSEPASRSGIQRADISMQSSEVEDVSSHEGVVSSSGDVSGSTSGSGIRRRAPIPE